MHQHQFTFRKRTLAILGCMALLYFVGGGGMMHASSELALTRLFWKS